MADHLASLGIIYLNTIIISTYPVVAELILADCVDVTQFNTMYARQSRHILAQSILVGSYPHTAVLSLHKTAQGIVADGCLVKLVMQELFPLLAFQVDYYQS